MAKRYHFSDGSLLLIVEPDPDGWFTVTSPIDPAMITQARTIEEAFEQARDAFAALADSRSDAARWRSPEGRDPIRPSPKSRRGNLKLLTNRLSRGELDLAVSTHR